MTNIESLLIEVANEGQTNDKIFTGEGFTRSFAGRVKRIAKLRNPLSVGLLVYEIENILEIIDPKMMAERGWLNKLKSAIKDFHNEIVTANRILGIKNDNEYDKRIFEKVVKERFWIELKDKDIDQNTLIETDFKTMVEMVELGVRRFAH